MSRVCILLFGMIGHKRKNGTKSCLLMLLMAGSAMAMPMLGKNRDLGTKLFKELDVQIKPCDPFYIGKKDTEALCGTYPDEVIKSEELDALITAFEYAVASTTKLVPVDKDWGRNTRECAPCRRYKLNGVTYNLIIDPWTNQIRAAMGETEDHRPQIVFITPSKK